MVNIIQLLRNEFFVHRLAAMDLSDIIMLRYVFNDRGYAQACVD